MKKELGKAIKSQRERLGMTQEQLGQLIGVDRANVSRYEKGINAPEIERLERLAYALNINLSHLIAAAEIGGLIDENIKGTVPLISWVQAGYGRTAIDNLQPGEGERIETTYRVRAHTFALRVTGDSMEPKFPQGCIVIVEPEENPESGKFVIIRQNGDEATLKQYVEEGGKKYLKPVNPRYPIYELGPDAVFCGVVKRVEMDV